MLVTPCRDVCSGQVDGSRLEAEDIQNSFKVDDTSGGRLARYDMGSMGGRDVMALQVKSKRALSRCWQTAAAGDLIIAKRPRRYDKVSKPLRGEKPKGPD